MCTFRRLELDGTFCQLVLIADDYYLSGPQHLAGKYQKVMETKFDATREPGTMFVGYDIDYNLVAGYVKSSFDSYIT